MSDVKWIKIITDIFDDEKILLIESMPDADAIIVIWFKLLCLAGKQNNSGVFILNDKIPYTESMLATIFRRKESTVRLALKTFEEFGMIKIIDGVITIPNWGKHQNLDQLESRKEYMRNYMKDYRKKQEQIADKTNSKVYGKPNSKVNVNYAEEEGEKEEEREVEGEEGRTADAEAPSCSQIVDLFNQICVSYPQVKVLSDARRKAINARLKRYTEDDLKTAFEKAEASSFLKGGNDRNWSANFDWIIKDTNLAKILDGNYDDREPKSKTSIYKNIINHTEDLYNQGLREWVAGE